MSKKMLIDATHEEETRVAVVDGDRLEEYDYESAFRKALKGNIYLAKVTRVEPSLQAAFVNFGGNRHGFLPFSEIHPDYFRIPISDREALIAEQEEMLKRMEEKDKLQEEEEDNKAAKNQETDDLENEGSAEIIEDNKDDVVTIDPDAAPEESDETTEETASEDDDIDEENSNEEDPLHEDGDINGNLKQAEPDEENDMDGNNAERSDSNDNQDDNKNNRTHRNNRSHNNRGRNNRGRYAAKRNRDPEIVDKEDDEQRFRFNLRRKYKIQEVIKRGQIMLIQVSKEERGNKGAAVGSYLSLPGRYCVLMPNSPRAGGVSRKIANHKDRKKMRDMLKHLDVPKGMSVILRTAGVTRTKTEIKRDLDYLLRLWGKIRELTLESSAPALVYEEADLIKRAVRDLYTRDVEEIIVSGEKSFKTAKSFMKMMIPSHAKRVTEYKDPVPLFTRYHVENQINEMSSPIATMKSGGYLVINPTEALVSIDVNSGKATKERHIEGTALKTNLEAADEVARQLRLRDLGGLVVIDFIDMEDRRNNAKVERRMREALSGDRARIQVGRISSFGLMELSRQRLNPSLTEAQYEVCPHCTGTGNIRTPDATSILVIRAIEEEGIKGRAAQLIVQVTNKVALYLLNHKRQHLSELEARYNIEILIRVDESLSASDFRIELGRRLQKDEQDNDNNNEEEEKSENKTRRGRRGGRRRKNNDNEDNKNSEETAEDTSEEKSSDDDNSEEKSKKPRRGRTRRNTKNKEDVTKEETSESKETSEEDTESKEEEKPKKRRTTRGRKKKDEEEQTSETNDNEAKTSEEKPAEEEKPKKRRGRKPKAKKDDEKEEAIAEASNDDSKKTESEPKADEPSHASQFETVNAPPEKKKKGWWNL